MKKNVFFFCILMMLGQALSVSAQTSPQLGDVNNNSVIDIIDALLVAQYYVGLIQTFAFPAAADVDGNGSVNIVDALLIAQYYVGLITSFPGQSSGEVQVVKSGLSRDPSPQPAVGELEALVAGNNQFAIDCYHQLQGKAGNIFFSPVSISFAFGMCYAGANGSTKTQLASALHFTLPENNLHNAFNALDLTLTSPPANPNSMMGEELQLHIANSTWGQINYSFVAEYLDVLACYYGAGINLVDFISQPEPSRILINDWVADATEQKIQDLLPAGSISDLTRLVLTNAIYFKANWLDPFDAKDTVAAPFSPLAGGTVFLPMMNQKLTTSYTEAAGEYQAVKLPYQGTKHNSMIIILPAAGKFTAFENGFSLSQFTAIEGALSRYQVTLRMPKFEYEWKSSLRKPLQALGMTDAFIFGQADFSGINGQKDLFIHDVLHKSFVAVDEIGTEAAAATAIIIGITSMPPTATMSIDRPFIYAIYNDDTATILFLGRVTGF